MQNRVLSGILAIGGGVLVALGCYLPYAQSGSAKLRIFDTSGNQHAVLFFAIEPFAVAIAVCVIGILLIVHPPFRFSGGALAAMGGQTILMFAGYIGFYHQAQFGLPLKAGGFVGIAGSALAGAAGIIVLASRDETQPAVAAGTPVAAQPAQPSGWYADPSNPVLLRYWSGSSWTQHTHPAAPPAAPPAAADTSPAVDTSPTPEPTTVVAPSPPPAPAPADPPAAADTSPAPEPTTVDAPSPPPDPAPADPPAAQDAPGEGTEGA
jgi:outer membrane biosynthesis protein TonB